MTAKTLFTTAVRILGVWELLRAFDFWIEAFDFYARYYRSETTSVGVCLTHIAVYTVLGIYMIYGAHMW